MVGGLEGFKKLDLNRFKIDTANGKTALFFNKNNEIGGKEEWVRLTQLRRGGINKPLGRGKLEGIFNEDTQSILAIKKLDETIPTDREFAAMSHNDLKNLITNLKKQVNGLNEYKNFMPLRELQGLDKALQRLEGEFSNNTAKLTELKNDIARQKNKLREQSLSNEQKAVIEKRLKGFQDEYKVRMETLSLQKTKLQTQFARIRQTIDKIADKDRSLKERLNILWREQGLTITSVLTAVGMTISTLVLALLPGGGAAGGAGDSGSSPHRVRDWVKRGL